MEGKSLLEENNQQFLTEEFKEGEGYLYLKK